MTVAVTKYALTAMLVASSAAGCFESTLAPADAESIVGSPDGSCVGTCARIDLSDGTAVLLPAGWWIRISSTETTEALLTGGLSSDDRTNAEVCDRLHILPTPHPEWAMGFVVWGHDADRDGYPEPGTYPVMPGLENPGDGLPGARIQLGSRDSPATVTGESGEIRLREVHDRGRLVIEVDIVLTDDAGTVSGAADLDWCLRGHLEP